MMDLHKLIDYIISRKESLSSTHSKKILELGATVSELVEDTLIVPLENNKYKLVKVSDINFIEEPKTNFVFIHTLDETIRYIAPTNLFELLPKKFNFKKIGRKHYVNIDNIVKYDSYLLRVYFSEDKYAVVTDTSMKEVIKKLLPKEKDVNQNTQEKISLRFLFR